MLGITGRMGLKLLGHLLHASATSLDFLVVKLWTLSRVLAIWATRLRALSTRFGI